MGDVPLNVVGEPPRALFLDGTVLFHRIGIASQKVPEGDVPVQFPGALGADIQMVGHQMGLTRIAERLPVRDAQITLVDVANIRQTAHHFFKDTVILDDHIDVNAWLG